VALRYFPQYEIELIRAKDLRLARTKFGPRDALLEDANGSARRLSVAQWAVQNPSRRGSADSVCAGWELGDNEQEEPLTLSRKLTKSSVPLGGLPCYMRFTRAVNNFLRYEKFHIQTLDPDYPTHRVCLVVWDTFIVLVTAIFALVIPFQIGLNYYPEAYSHLYSGIDAVLLVDLYVRCHTAVQVKGVVLRDRAAIRQQIPNFWLVLFVSLPLDLLAYLAADSNQARPYCQVHRIVLLRGVLRRLFKAWGDHGKGAIQNLITVLFVIIWGVHLLACVWAKWGIRDDCRSSWVAQFPLLATTSVVPECRNRTVWSPIDRTCRMDLLQTGVGAEAVVGKVQTYAISLYFVVVVSATIGFGDIVPSNTIEREVCCVLMFAGSVMIAALLACIAVSIQVSPQLLRSMLA
jgi:hypothetical protein